MSSNVSTSCSIKFDKFAPKTTFKRTAIGWDTGLKRMIVCDIIIDICQIIIEGLIVGEMIFGGTIIDGTIIGATAGIVTIDDEKRTNKMIEATIETVMTKIIHLDGIEIIDNLKGVVNIRRKDDPMISKGMTIIDHRIIDSMIIDHRIIDSMIIESRKDVDSFNVILEPKMTRIRKMLTDFIMKMANPVAHLCRFAIFAGSMIITPINGRQRHLQKAKHSEWEV